MIRHLLTAAAVAALSACASGSTPRQAPAEASMGPPQVGVEGYLSAAMLDGKSILGPPPAPDSPHGKADRTMYEDTRKLAGSARWQTAIQDNDLWGGGAIKRFSCAIGVDISPRHTPAAWKILHKIEQDVRTIGKPAKDFYDRKRPLIGNDAPICVAREEWMKTNASYPSGHAMTAWAWGLILAEAVPAKASAVLALAKDSGDSRVVCGVHFPSDVEAGRTLGSSMVARLHAQPEFQSDLAEAKQEVAAAPAPSGCAS